MVLHAFSKILRYCRGTARCVMSVEILVNYCTAVRTRSSATAEGPVEATLSNATSRTILSMKSNVASTMLPLSATMSNEMSSFRQFRNRWNMFDLFRLCRKDAILTRSTLLPFLATKSNELLRHCCWCGLGLTIQIFELAIGVNN